MVGCVDGTASLAAVWQSRHFPATSLCHWAWGTRVLEPAATEDHLQPLTDEPDTPDVELWQPLQCVPVFNFTWSTEVMVDEYFENG